MKTKNNQGLAPIAIVVSIIVVAVLGYGGYVVFTNNEVEVEEGLEEITEEESLVGGQTETNTDVNTKNSNVESNSQTNTEVTSDTSAVIKFDKYADAVASGKNLRCSRSSKGFDGIEKEISVTYFSSDGKIRKESHGTFSGVVVYTENKVYNQPDISVDEVEVFTGSEAKMYRDKLMTQSMSSQDCEEAMVSDSMFVL